MTMLSSEHVKLFQVCLLTYTMAFQCVLYLLYVCLFVLCHLVRKSSYIYKFQISLNRLVITQSWKKLGSL